MIFMHLVGISGNMNSRAIQANLITLIPEDISKSEWKRYKA